MREPCFESATQRTPSQDCEPPTSNPFPARNIIAVCPVQCNEGRFGV
jgi:hypothetical protein